MQIKSLVNNLPKREIYMTTNQATQFFALPDEAGARLPLVKEVLGCSAATVWRLVRQGKITAIKISAGVTLFNVGTVRALLNPENKQK
jgi:hypothetical protein